MSEDSTNIKKYFKISVSSNFSVTSDGTTGEGWLQRQNSKNFLASDRAKNILCSPDFKPTNGVTTNIVVLTGILFEDNDRITKKIRSEADKRKLTKPDAEVACLIREKFTDEEIKVMGLYGIVAMHDPIELLGLDDPGHRWSPGFGFAFVAS